MSSGDGSRRVGRDVRFWGGRFYWDGRNGLGVIGGLVSGLVGGAGEGGGCVWKAILILVVGLHVSQGVEIRKCGNTEMRNSRLKSISGRPKCVVDLAWLEDSKSN